MAVYLSNGLSLKWFPTDSFIIFRTRRINPSAIPRTAISAIRNARAAQAISKIVGCNLPVDKTPLKLTCDDVLFVAQYKGTKILEGFTALPEDFNFFEVTFVPQGCSDCPATECEKCGFINWSHGL